MLMKSHGYVVTAEMRPNFVRTFHVGADTPDEAERLVRSLPDAHGDTVEAKQPLNAPAEPPLKPG